MHSLVYKKKRKEKKRRRNAIFFFLNPYQKHIQRNSTKLLLANKEINANLIEKRCESTADKSHVEHRKEAISQLQYVDIILA